MKLLVNLLLWEKTSRDLLLAIKCVGVFLNNTVVIAKNVDAVTTTFVRIEKVLMVQDSEVTTLTIKETTNGYLNAQKHFMFHNRLLCYVLEQHYLALYSIT